MLPVKFYITVILPLRIEWEPWYYAETVLERGTRIKVKFAGKEYVGVVNGVFGRPGIDENKIRKIEEVETQLSRITDGEMRLWKFIAEYYMCTLGEVYKTAYPAIKTEVEYRKPRKKSDDTDKCNLIIDRLEFNDRFPLLLIAPNRSSAYNDIIDRTLADGKDVLYLSPYAQPLSYTQIRDISASVRALDSSPQVIYGRKNALFLPFTKLGLIIVDEEQDSSYKQNSPSPRYNGRDVAVMLAAIHNADIVLGTSSPSLESIYNVITGKYKSIEYQGIKCPVEIIDTSKEARKNGMEGDCSKKLLSIKKDAETNKKKILIVESWDLGKISRLKLERYAAVAILHFEYLLSRQDFRADEKALQIIDRLRSIVSRLIIQTKDSSHPVFSGRSDLMAERKSFHLPPFKRQIDITLKDYNQKRLDLMSKELTDLMLKQGFENLRGSLSDGTFLINLYLAKDKNLSKKKIQLARIISDFESNRKYSGHISINVDPL